MKKIPTIYQRDPETKLKYVKAARHPDCGWVFDGEGTPTYKWDGTAVRIDEAHRVWKRREVKADRPEPDGFRQEGDPDPNTGKRVGWVPAVRGQAEDKWIFEAVDEDVRQGLTHWPGTFELIGPKVQGNPHEQDRHVLYFHGGAELGDVPTDFVELGRWLNSVGSDDLEDQDGNLFPPGFEGVVWHHPDGRMAKIKVRDFPKPNAS